MNNTIKITKIDLLIEEEVFFSVNLLEIIDFNLSPQELEVGEAYEAHMDIFMIVFLEMQNNFPTNLYVDDDDGMIMKMDKYIRLLDDNKD